MSTTMRLTDDAIRAALTPAPELRAPTGLADGIRATIDSVPQRRPGLLGWTPSRRTGLVLRLVVAGLLVLGLIGALLLVGSRPSVPRGPSATATTYHGGPERTGVMPGPAPSGSLRVEWQGDLKGPVGPWSPAVDAGRVFVGDEGGYVSAFDEATGGVRWQVSVGAPVNCGITVASGLVIVGDDAGVVHALDEGTGTERWSYRAGKAVHSAAAVLGSTAYVGDADGRLYGFDVATGRAAWPGPVVTPGPIGRTIAAAGGLLYAGSGGARPTDPGSLGAYDAAIGTLRWSAPLQPGNASTPAVSGGRVVVSDGLDASSTAVHRLYAFDAATGNAAWASPFAAPSGKVLLQGAVTSGRVYETGTDGTLYVIDAATGALAWQLPIGSSQTPNAAFVDGTLYVTSDDRRIHAVDVSGQLEAWAYEVPGIPSAPAVVDGRIIVATNLGKLVSIVGSNQPPGASPSR